MQANMDPTVMSVRQLRSVLSEYGVDVPSGTVRKTELVMLFLEEGVAARAQARAKKDQAMQKKQKKRKSSSIPWADVNVVPKKSQRKSFGQEEPRDTSPPHVARKSSRGPRQSPAVATKKRKRSTPIVSESESDSESESESEGDTVMTDVYGGDEIIDLSLSPSPPPVKKRGRGTDSAWKATIEKREREKREKEKREKEKEKEKERAMKERELIRKQERELESLKRAQEKERKKIERRQSEEIAMLTAKREALEIQKQKLQAALSERDVSSIGSLAVPTAPSVKRRATASPRAQKRSSLLPRLTPENTRRRREEERESFSSSVAHSPPPLVASTSPPPLSQWPSAPLSPPDHKAESFDASDTEEYYEEDEETFVYREEDEEGLSLEVLVTSVVALLILSVAVFLFINFRPVALPYCNSTQNENCVPCPRHGTCEGREVTCDSGFIKQWAGGKWHCVEDMETKRIAHAVLTNEFERLLRQRKGERDCNQLSRPVMLEHEAKIELEEMYKARVGSKKAAATFVDFYREIERLVTLDPELPVSRESGTAGYYFTTSSAPLRPLGCSLKLFFIERALYIAIGSVVAAVVTFKVWQLRAVSHTKNLVLRELKKARAEQDSGLSIVHLRDTVAPPSIFKGFVWSGVCSSIEADSRVGRTLQLLNGEHQDMWEWEAPL